MAEIRMRRRDNQAGLDTCQHAGLMLERGFDTWTTDNNQYNKQKQTFYNDLLEINPSELYKQAFIRWERYLKENPERCQTWPGLIVGRLYLGLGEANPLESAVTLHHSYGVPFIPGSAIKGVLHHALVQQYAKSYDEKKRQYHLEANEQAVVDTLFGREPNPEIRDDSGEAGFVIFNDAWWIPEGKKPLVKEIVTVHHEKYYRQEGPATDFDSPNPNPQIAIQGSFLFSVMGEQAWAKFAIKLIQQVLQHKGIGAKTSSGYGYFQAPREIDQNIIETWAEARLGRFNLTGVGDCVEAVFDKKTARASSESLKAYIENLSNSAKKKLRKNNLTHAVKVKKTGNVYQIIELLFDENN